MSNTVSVNDLSPDQRAAYNSVTRWVSSGERNVLTLGGYAGSGKSTLVSLIASQVNLPAFVAYTGKATSVLRRKLKAAGTQTVGVQPRQDGMPSLDSRPFCGTIHSLIYRPCECLEPKTVELDKPCPDKTCDAELSWHAEENKAVCAKGHRPNMTAKAFELLKRRTKFVYAQRGSDGRCKLCNGKEWLRRETLDRRYGLIIIDEASMVDDIMLRDLREFGVPILAVGDHGQLPPVGGVGSLMKAPHLRLEKIHRQAEGNPIIALSKIIRETGRLPETMEGDAVTFAQMRLSESIIERRYENASPERLLEMGLACYTNRRRLGLNTAVRRVLGNARTGRELPRKGEHVVCLRNMKTRDGGIPVFNGMRGVLTSDALPKKNRNYQGEEIGESETHLVGTVSFTEDGVEEREFEMLRAQFGREKTFSSPEELAKETGIHSFSSAGALFDFGFAMTVHKMQGSQYKDLLVVAERPGPVSHEEYARWLYTAVTRASEKLTVLR